MRFEAYIRYHGLRVADDVAAACLFLEERGWRFRVEFDEHDAVEKAGMLILCDLFPRRASV